MGAKDISPEAISRMVALVRQMADQPLHGQLLFDVDEEARAIVALLPEPIDPDLLEARKIALKYALPAIEKCMTSHSVNNGDGDQLHSVKAILEAIKLGRQLSQDQPS